MAKQSGQTMGTMQSGKRRDLDDTPLFIFLIPVLMVDRCPENAFRQRSAQLGLAIDLTTLPKRDGESMDHAMAIDGMFSASGDFAVD